MTAKSCQLCGKPLSRLRVGGDGDFCSREHRNQHRLRRGMDRLEEANKVTSLMRRRENPRHISSTQLMCNSALERRGFFEPKQLASKAGTAAFSPVLRGPAAPRVVSGADRYVAPRASRLAGAKVSRRADASLVRIDGRGTLPVIPRRRQKLPVQISMAPLVSLSCERAAAPASARDFRMLRHGEIRVHLGRLRSAAGVGGSRRGPALEPQTRLRKIGSAPLAGSALRVSIGIGFRVGKVNWHDFSIRPPAQAYLLWPRATRRVSAGIHDCTAAYRNLEVGIATLSARLPAVPNGARAAQFVFPGTVAPRLGPPLTGDQPAKRTTDVLWKPADPRPGWIAVVPPSAGFARRNGTHLRIAMTPTSTRPAQQVASATFLAREPVGCPRVDFEGTVAAAIVSAPGGTETASSPVAPAAPAEVVRIEEHFGSGWDNWMGGTKGWRVDVAGVRTGPLALFVPSMQLIDYDLEFLARIDTRSLTWVVRAAGLDEHLRCTLTAVGGGQVEFSRCAVVAGAEQELVTSPQLQPGKPRSAMTVTTRVSGHTFTVSVDGKNIDTWNDDRFPMGGIGFSGASDDRARLYWVRLSSTELNGKEYQKK